MLWCRDLLPEAVTSGKLVKSVSEVDVKKRRFTEHQVIGF